MGRVLSKYMPIIAGGSTVLLTVKQIGPGKNQEVGLTQEVGLNQGVGLNQDCLGYNQGVLITHVNMSDTFFC